EDETLIPESASLEQNYPNPFNNKTTITFSVKENEEAQLEIYDLYGRLVRTFTGFDTGSHNVIWDGTDNAKKEVSSGLYFYKLKTSGNTSIRRMLLLK
ncbi:MAG: T9SS type A sorting domain-containing protein, partial [candidate division Zixibacteria bacterium]|nr:T9SS type A sorting domain-containing protein [candidate division Zixibacteria bacterium]